jgi:hypothetical protein
MVGTTTKDISGLVGEQAIRDLQSNGVCSTDCQQSDWSLRHRQFALKLVR